MTKDKGDVRVREMVEADLLNVKMIDHSLVGGLRTPTWPFPFETYWQVCRPDIHLVAELEGAIAGFVVGTIVEEEHNQSITSLTHTLLDFHRHQWIGWIDVIGVHPMHQHKGIGKALIEAFHAECQRNNAVMRGVARESDESLKSFLEAMGFRKWDIATYEKH